MLPPARSSSTARMSSISPAGSSAGARRVRVPRPDPRRRAPRRPGDAPASLRGRPRRHARRELGSRPGKNARPTESGGYEMKRRRAAYVAAVLAVAGAAAAVNSSKAPAGGPVRGGTLTMARIADIFTMDPVQTIDDRSIFTDLQI